MQEVFAIGLHSMHQDMNGLDRIAMNLTNAATPGYQRAVSLQRPFATLVAGQLAPAGAVLAGIDGELAARAPLPEIINDVRPGTLKPTGNALDLALAGPGYFEIATADGPAYTRQGDFQVDARGRLVTAHGDPVMAKGGELFLAGDRPRIDAAGNVSEPGADAGASVTVGQLKIVRFDDGAHMPRLGNGLLGASGPATVMDDADIALRQSYLENANVSSMREMVELMQTMRHFESMQRVVQGYDEMLGTAIRKLGDA